MQNYPLERIDKNDELRAKLLPYCRLSHGEIWEDDRNGHRVGCLDAANPSDMSKLVITKADLAIHDPPYNLVAFQERTVAEFIHWCRTWIKNTETHLKPNSALYIWLGADQDKGFQPLPEFMIMMREFIAFKSRAFLTMRNKGDMVLPTIGWQCDKNVSITLKAHQILMSNIPKSQKFCGATIRNLMDKEQKT